MIAGALAVYASIGILIARFGRGRFGNWGAAALAAWWLPLLGLVVLLGAPTIPFLLAARLGARPPRKRRLSRPWEPRGAEGGAPQPPPPKPAAKPEAWG